MLFFKGFAYLEFLQFMHLAIYPIFVEYFRNQQKTPLFERFIKKSKKIEITQKNTAKKHIVYLLTEMLLKK